MNSVSCSLRRYAPICVTSYYSTWYIYQISKQRSSSYLSAFRLGTLADILACRFGNLLLPLWSLASHSLRSAFGIRMRNDELQALRGSQESFPNPNPKLRPSDLHNLQPKNPRKPDCLESSTSTTTFESQVLGACRVCKSLRQGLIVETTTIVTPRSPDPLLEAKRPLLRVFQSQAPLTSPKPLKSKVP